MESPHGAEIESLRIRTERLERDMWFGNGKPGMTVRMQQAEDKLDGYEDILPKMKAFLTVQTERDAQADKRWWKQPLGTGAIVALIYIGWDLLKGHLGVK